MTPCSEYGEIIAVPTTIINKHGQKEDIAIYNPVQETPQFVGLMNIIKKWIFEEFNIDEVIPFITKVMCVVNQAVSSPHAGEYKKKLVLSLMFCCIKVSNILVPDKEIAYSVIHHIAPSAIDTIVSVAKGKIDIKKSMKFVERNCFSIFDSSINKRQIEMSNEIAENVSLKPKEEKVNEDKLEEEKVNEDKAKEEKSNEDKPKDEEVN